MSYKIKSVYGMMPNQAEGTLNGEVFYFRARHGEWTLQVAKDVNDDCWRTIDYGSGEVLHDAKPGWWSLYDCRRFVTQLMKKHSDGSHS